MKIATKVMFASALMLSVVAPSLSYAAYFVDPTKTWALETRRAQLKHKFQGKEASVDFMAPTTRQCPERVLTRTTRPRA
jgi:hypothetical protein